MKQTAKDRRVQIRTFIAALTDDEKEMLKTTLAMLKDRVWDRLHAAACERNHFRLSETDCTNQRYRVEGARTKEEDAANHKLTVQQHKRDCRARSLKEANHAE